MFQGLGCFPIRVVHELSSERCEIILQKKKKLLSISYIPQNHHKQVCAPANIECTYLANSLASIVVQYYKVIHSLVLGTLEFVYAKYLVKE